MVTNTGIKPCHKSAIRQICRSEKGKSGGLIQQVIFFQILFMSYQNGHLLRVKNAFVIFHPVVKQTFSVLSVFLDPWFCLASASIL